jgi:GNAT superfamily N-acetyltransferase
MLIGDYYFHLRFDGGESALKDDDPSHYAHSISGTVIGLDKGDNETLAGKFHLYYLDICAAVNARTSVFDVFDCRAATLDYYSAIFAGASFTISEKLEKLFDFESAWGNVLILERLEILPAFRGRNLGLIVMRRLIERFGSGAAYIAIKPFPLQGEYIGNKEEDPWRAELQLLNLDKNHRRATTKLHRYYRKLGFKTMKGTPFMFRMGDYELPSPDDLMK